MTVSFIQDRNTPGDNRLSSGDSVFEENMDKIDNHANVLNYDYKQSKLSLYKQKFDFVNEIDVFTQPDDFKKHSHAVEEYPQGICITEEYIFISLYSGVRGHLGKIKVFDKESGVLLLTLGMDENSHLGGLTYDGEYIWVCNSSKMSVERISYVFIQQMIHENKGKMIDARNLVDIYRVKNVPSCVTYYDGQLWVATHSIWTNATMVAYDFDVQKNRLNSLVSFHIPSKVQGVTFSDIGEVYLSTSYGRKNSSYIKKYKSIYSMTDNVNHYIELIELPPCSEGIAYDNHKLYVLFESAGMKYREGTDGKGRSAAPLDKILRIQM